MKYLIMCGRPTFYELDGEQIIARTIRLLQENGITDIAITTTDERYKQFGKVIKYNSYKQPYYWVNAFYNTKEPTCYIFGDVFFSNKAIKTIVETETDDIEFFASSPPFHPSYPKKFAEPFAFKVVNTEHFRKAINKTKRLWRNKKFSRHPIAWELWQVIRGTELNRIDYTNYVAINDFTCDIDTRQDAGNLRALIQYGILKEED